MNIRETYQDTPKTTGGEIDGGALSENTNRPNYYEIAESREKPETTARSATPIGRIGKCYRV